MTHAELVKIACRWLKNTKRCGLVFAEAGKNVCREEPDALGFFGTGHWSCVVECKTSRADFFADREKPSHRAGLGLMGTYRWYLTMDGIVTPADVPSDHGLLVVRGKAVHVLVEAPVRADRAVVQELTWLYCVARRHQLGVEWKRADFRFEISPAGERMRAQREAMRARGR